MSLFALNYEYQRSIDRIWKDFSVHARAQTEPAAKEARSVSQQSAIDPGGQRELFAQDETRSTTTPQAVGGSELMQYDVKAWGRFLDSKRGG